MNITVAICTWNRCELLRQTLEQMRNLEVPQGVEWELLIVNNNCTDFTDKVISCYAEYLPIRRLFEVKPGKSNACNCVIQHARGNYILWTDDDVLVDENWLTAYHEAFLRWPEAAVFGGPIEPWFQKPPPEWLQQVLPRVAGAYAIRNFGDEPMPLSERWVVPFGANFAVRAKEQAGHLYDVRRGPRPGSPLRGEETDVINAILSGGGAGWWVPRARVKHYIPPDRQTIRYLRSFFFGIERGLELTSCDPSAHTWFGKPRWLWRAAVEAELKYRWRRCFKEPTEWIGDLKKSSAYWGMLGISLLCPYER